LWWLNFYFVVRKKVENIKTLFLLMRKRKNHVENDEKVERKMRKNVKSKENDDLILHM